MVGQLVGLAASPVISRLYTREDNATLALFATVVSCAAPIVCLRFESAVSVPEDDRVAARILLAGLSATALVSIVSLILVAMGGNGFAQACRDPKLAPYLWLLPVSLLGIGVYQCLSYWVIRQRAFSINGKTRMVQGVSQAACQVGLGWTNLGSTGLILGDVLGRIAGAGTLARFAWAKNREAFRGHTWSDIKGTAREYSAFPRVSVPATVLHTATTNFTLLLAPIYGGVQYGLYFFGIRYLWSPVSMVAQAMAQVYLGEASKWAREDPDLMLRSFDQICKRLAVIGIVPFSVLALLGSPITVFVFGPRWSDAGVLVQIQALSWWVMFVVGPVINTLNILGRQSWQLWADATGVALMALGLWMSCLRGWSIQVAVGLYSVSIIGMYIWLFFACRRAIVVHVRQGETADR